MRERPCSTRAGLARPAGGRRSSCARPTRERRMPDDARATAAVARALLEAGTVTLTPDEPVTFKSGLRSPVYVDNRRLIFQPAPWRTIIEAFAAQLPDGRRRHRRRREPPASPTAARWPSRPVCLRSSCARRPRGTGSAVASRVATSAGRRTILVEDMVTTGGSSLSAVEALREAGAEVARLPGHHHLRLRRGARGLRCRGCHA